MSCIVKKITGLFRAVLGRSTDAPKTAAIILAAGSSTRMDSEIPKQLIEINDMPIMIRSMLAFEESESISEIILVAPEEYVSYYRSLVRSYKIKKLVAVTAGGTTRNESAANGFKRVSTDVKFVAIHDAARCLVTPEIIDRVCASAYKYNAATAATRSTDSVKISGKSKFIDRSESRVKVWLAQTPQVFNADLYRAASFLAKESNLSPTDDNGLIENVNHKVRLVECGKYNLKITTPDDLIVAKAILDARAEGRLQALADDEGED